MLQKEGGSDVIKRIVTSGTAFVKWNLLGEKKSEEMRLKTPSNLLIAYIKVAASLFYPML